MYICTYENIHICVYAHMIERAYDNGSGCVLEHLFGAQPVAQNRTPVQNAIAAGLRRRAVANQPPIKKQSLMALFSVSSPWYVFAALPYPLYFRLERPIHAMVVTDFIRLMGNLKGYII